jgi:hypothetical protein
MGFFDVHDGVITATGAGISATIYPGCNHSTLQTQKREPSGPLINLCKIIHQPYPPNHFPYFTQHSLTIA